LKSSHCVHSLWITAFALITLHLGIVNAQESSDPLRAAFVKRIDEEKQAIGVLAALLTPDGKSFSSYGRVSADGPAPTADTIFELGSIGKVFTDFLFADMVERGEVGLDDPLKKYLPASVTVPSRGGREITLRQLAMHASGLPRDSVPVDLTSDVSPYVGYTAAQLYAFLGGYRLERDPGSQVEYSNIGVALLGHALSLRAGMSYEELLRRRLTEPLGMTNTTVTMLPLTAEQRSRRATGHNSRLQPVPPWTGGVLAPTGGMSTTAADMLKFGAAILDSKSPMRATFARMTSVRVPLEEEGTYQALGWAMFKYRGNDMLGHSGATFGFNTRMVVDTTRKRAVIVWINGRAAGAVGDLVGLALERPRLSSSF
jgi:CubicO group peptidase (beta-lactamase class C family)